MNKKLIKDLLEDTEVSELDRIDKTIDKLTHIFMNVVEMLFCTLFGILVILLILTFIVLAFKVWGIILSK